MRRRTRRSARPPGDGYRRWLRTTWRGGRPSPNDRRPVGRRRGIAPILLSGDGAHWSFSLPEVLSPAPAQSLAGPSQSTSGRWQHGRRPPSGTGEHPLVAEAGDDAVTGVDALWLSRSGKRMSSRAVDLLVRRLATAAQLELSAHVLRHTFVNNLIRSGADVVLVAEIAGHRRLETTRRYSMPSHADKDAAVEAVLVEI